MSKNMNKRATKRKSTPENYILIFLTVSSVSSDSIVTAICMRNVYTELIIHAFLLVFIA
jgi:hypothetical protein